MFKSVNGIRGCRGGQVKPLVKILFKDTKRNAPGHFEYKFFCHNTIAILIYVTE